MTWNGIQPLRFGFVAEAPEDTRVPPPHRAKPNKRRMAALHRASEVLSVLPESGESLHALMTGEYDLMHLVVILCDSRPCPVEHLRLATLSFNGRNLAEMLRLLDSGKVGRLSLLTSHFMAGHDKSLWEETLTEFRARGQQAAAPRSHCKVVTVAFLDGTRYALEGSANLRTNKNFEQFQLTNDAGLHDWHCTWIDRLLNTRTGDERANPPTG